jgi:hypothetical protein
VKLDVAPKTTDQLIPTPIVHQTAFWGRVHRRLGFGTDAFDVSFRPAASSTPDSPPGAPPAGSVPAAEHGDFLVVRAPLSDDLDYAYVPFGPEIEPDADSVGTFLEKLSRELRPLLGPRCAFIRWDLPWTSVHARDRDDDVHGHGWEGPPPSHLRELRMNFGTLDHNLWKAPRDLLPPDTVLLDVTRSEDELLARMHHKTRYNIRLAQRRGVVVHEGTLADLPAWYELYVETMQRHHLRPLPLAHFKTMLEERAEGSASPVVTKMLLARHEGTLLAGMLLALAPTRATYLYGGSTRAHRDLMASYAMQWAAIRQAKAHGCIDYDMFGAAPGNGHAHPLSGVHRFKIGFGGRLVHREGCWDFPYDEKTYKGWRGAEEAEVLRRAIGRD